MPNLSAYQGHGQFAGPETVRVNGELLQADSIFINTGAKPDVPGLPGLDQVDYLTSSSILDVDDLPEHLVIIGGSYIGLEFAQMYRRFGSRVTVIESGPRLIGRDDEDVAEAVKGVLRNEGVGVRLNAQCTRVERRDGRVGVRVLDNDPRRVSDRIPAYALYIDPPLGRVGMTEQQVRESGRKALIAHIGSCVRPKSSHSLGVGLVP
jgi:pyruvate/2-oxoglutarate dehydrogenase complex dihydrolipoamide dehydrogenase (E3) component